MPIDAETLKSFIERELARVPDGWVVARIRGMLVEPHIVLRYWDYGAPDQQYPCWMVLKDVERTGAEIAYCEHGFGPRSPWGLVSSGDSPANQRMGIDCSWFTTFLDAFFDSFAATTLPIWRIIKTERDGTARPLTEAEAWELTWQRIADLRSADAAGRYDCRHSIRLGDS